MQTDVGISVLAPADCKNDTAVPPDKTVLAYEDAIKAPHSAQAGNFVVSLVADYGAPFFGCVGSIHDSPLSADTRWVG